MQISFSTPERCLLVQAAHWFIDGTLPVPDDTYRLAPVELKADNSELRDLFLALQLTDCDVRGDLVLEIKKKMAPHEEKKSNYTPLTSLLRDTKVELDTVSLNNVVFSNSIINTAHWVIAKTAAKEIKKQRQRQPSDEGWPGKFFYQHVTVNFSKLNAILSRAEESTPSPAKRGTPSIESAGDTKTANPKSQNGQLTKPAPTRGRPRKWDWDEIFTEIVLLANTPDGLPETQADLERWVAEKFIELCGDHPSPSWIRKMIGPIYQRIRFKSQ